MIRIADRDHDREELNVQTNRFFDIHEGFVVKTRKNRRTGVGAERDRLIDRRGNHRAEDTACTHQAVCIGDQRHDVEVDTLQTGGRSHDETVIEREHDRATRLLAENLRKTGLNTVARVFVPLKEELFLNLRNADAKIFRVNIAFIISHVKKSFPAVVFFCVLASYYVFA